ncbi:MAG: Gfo/Idh/MocA family oxidoreductase [Planctomycetota bacterium]
MIKKRISRRGFLQAAAASGVFTIVPRHVLGGEGQVPPSAKLNIAGIGVGGKGFGNMRSLESENIVALCDVDHEYAAKAFKQYPQAKVYADYRQMLEKEKGIDAVMIATPDHTHAVIAMAAIQAGKHVYCEKPLTHDVYEARTLAKAARESKVVTQMGIQGHSMEGARLVCEWIQAGAIGEVTEVDAWCTLSYYPPGRAHWSPKWLRRPEETMPVPEKLNWDVWIGPAKMRPYHRAYHPGCWRAWWDFGNGMMGDRGVHTLDPVIWAIKLGYPESVDATSLDLNPDTHPLASVVTFRFPAREGLPPVKLTWYDGLRPPRPPELEDGRIMGHPEGGAFFKGTKGNLACGIYAESPRLIPESAMKEFLPNRPPKTIPRVEGGHHEDWIRACKSGGKAGAHFEYGALVTEICLLGNIAKRVDGRIEWDAQNMKVTNLADANQYVRTEYRQGWSL